MATQTPNLGYTNYLNVDTRAGNLDRFLGYIGFETDTRRQQDWQNNEAAQNNQLMRDLYFQEQANKFNAEQGQIQRDYNSAEAQKAWERNEQSAQNQRDFEERLSNTQAQRAVEDLKKAGINPILGYNGGASVPTGASASGPSASASSVSSSGSRSSGGFNPNNPTGNLLGTLLQVAVGMYTNGANNAVKLKLGKEMAETQKMIAEINNKTKIYKKKR